MVEHTIKLFADDTKLFSQVNNIEDCQGLQQDINHLQEWSRTWLLKFHPAKCKVLRVGTGHPEYQYNMHDDENQPVTLEEISSEKDIGVTMDQDLKFRIHIDSTVAKANRLVGMIRRSFVFLDKSTFKNLFKVIVRPHLEYGNIIWAPRTKKDRDLIESVQRRATKLVPGLYEKTYEERLKILDLPSLEYRRKRGDMIEMFKFMTNKYQVSTPWLILDDSTATRGHRFKLKKQSCKSDIRKNVFSLRVFNLWNALPHDVVDAPSVDAFKGRLDKHWKNKQRTMEF